MSDDEKGGTTMGKADECSGYNSGQIVDIKQIVYHLDSNHLKILHISSHDGHSPSEQVLNESLQLTNKNYELQIWKTNSNLPDDIFNTYDTILVSMWCTIDTNKLGNLLANAVDKGKPVVILLFSNNSSHTFPKGRFMTEGYNATTRAPCQGSSSTLGTIYKSDHPIMNGIKQFNTGSDNRRSMGKMVQDKENVDRIADWEDGNVFIAVRHNKPGLIIEMTTSIGTSHKYTYKYIVYLSEYECFHDII